MVAIKRYKNYPSIIAMINQQTKKPFAICPSEATSMAQYLTEAYTFIKEHTDGELIIELPTRKPLIANAKMEYFELMDKAYYLVEHMPSTLRTHEAIEIDIKNVNIPADVINNPVLAFYYDKLAEIFKTLHGTDIIAIVKDNKVVQPTHSTEYNNAYAEFVEEYNKALEARRVGDLTYMEYMIRFEQIAHNQRKLELLSKYPALKETCLVLKEHIQEVLKNEKNAYNISMLKDLEVFLDQELIEEETIENEEEYVN